MAKTVFGDQTDFLFKLVVVGGIINPMQDSGVGKTNLLTRYSNDKFLPSSKPTVGVQFAIKSLEIDDKKIKAQIWDTAGQQRFRAITQTFYRGCHGALIVYDISSRKSFEDVEKWNKELINNADENIIKILVGNKSDLADSRSVSEEEAIQLAQELKLSYFQTSALNNLNVDKAFFTLIQCLYTRVKGQERRVSELKRRGSQIEKPVKGESKFQLDRKEKERKGCCN